MRLRLVLLAAALGACRPDSTPTSEAEKREATKATAPVFEGMGKRPFRCIIDGETFARELRSEWRGYILATLNRVPRDTMQVGLRYLHDRDVHALELGAGAGNDTRYLLGLGLRVHAVEPDPFAVAVLHECAEQQGTSAALTVQSQTFETMRLPEAEFGFVHASLSLPFTQPDAFLEVWKRIVASMAQGAIFSGDFFGPRHGWAGNPELTILTAEAVRVLFTEHGLTILAFDETDARTPVVDGEEVRFHKFDVVAERTATSE